MNVDTIACFVMCDDPLPPERFQKVKKTVDPNTGEVEDMRFIHNPTEKSGYQPKVTGWSWKNMLKLEFSVPKMLGVVDRNLTWTETQEAIERVQAFVVKVLGFKHLVHVGEWTVQRIDYVWMWDTGIDTSVYLAHFEKLRLSTMTRTPFSGQGVVWKQKTRWVKLYDKTREQHDKDKAGSKKSYEKAAGKLRFEVSSYKEAVKYLCKPRYLKREKRWSEERKRTVKALIRPERALEVLERYYELLGMDVPFGHDQMLVFRLRDAFGRRSLAAASHALHCITDFGVASHVEHDLMSGSNYNDWKNKLKAAGFVVADDKRDDGRMSVVLEPLPVLALPSVPGGAWLSSMSEELSALGAENLGNENGAVDDVGKKTSEKIRAQK